MTKNRRDEFDNILKQLKLSYVKKGTKQYDQVMAILNKRCPKQEFNPMWTKACQNLGYQFVKKDTEEYKLVKDEYTRLKNEESLNQNSI
jgi:hypothetical protein